MGEGGEGGWICGRFFGDENETAHHPALALDLMPASTCGNFAFPRGDPLHPPGRDSNLNPESIPQQRTGTDKGNPTV